MNMVNKWLDSYPKVKAGMYSGSWLLLMLFFTYTPLFSAMIHVDASVMVEYLKMESQMISMVVNFGLVFMIVIDSWCVQQELSVGQHFINYLSFFLVLGIYWHSRYCCSGVNDNLEGILSWQGCSLVMHLLLLALLFWTKLSTVYKSSTVDYDRVMLEFQ